MVKVWHLFDVKWIVIESGNVDWTIIVYVIFNQMISWNEIASERKTFHVVSIGIKWYSGTSGNVKFCLF